MKKTIRLIATLLLAAICITGSMYAQQTESTTDVPRVISYQGALSATNGTAWPDGEYDITVTFYSDQQGQQSVWEDTYRTTVRGGVFGVYLGSGNKPLPTASITNKPIWVGTRINGGQEMYPLTPLTASPYALNVADGSVTTKKLAAGAVTADKVDMDYVAGIRVNGELLSGAGTIVDIDTRNGFSATASTSSEAGQIDKRENEKKGSSILSTPDAWNSQGDLSDGAAQVRTVAGNWLGTTSNGSNGEYDLIMKVNDEQIMKYLPQYIASAPQAGATPNILGGNGANSILVSAIGSIIAGGGSSANPNSISGTDYNTISGGEDNSISVSTAEYNIIGGGLSNSIDGLSYNSILGGEGNIIYNSGSDHSSIGGGHQNVIGTELVPADYAIIGGGKLNKAQADFSSVGGGENNESLGLNSTVSGGKYNNATGTESAIAGGRSNTASGLQSTVGGGGGNGASATNSTIGGGTTNSATAISSTVGGGNANNATAASSTIGGGQTNNASASHATVAGGEQNLASGTASVIGGGSQNAASMIYASILGGCKNRADGEASTVGGGEFNYSLDDYTFIGGGNLNTSSGIYSSVVGGDSNYVPGGYSVIGGGKQNDIVGNYSALGGGLLNFITPDFSFIGSGENNKISSEASYNVIGGGRDNTIATSAYITIGGGNNNKAEVLGSTISGGVNNTIKPGNHTYATISGGIGNTILQAASGSQRSGATIGGGATNIITPDAYISTIPGGDFLIAKGYGQVVVGVFNAEKGNMPFRQISATQTQLDQPIFIVGNGDTVMGQNNRSNAFEVSYDGHSIVFDENGTGGYAGAPGRGAVKGGTYTDNVIYAWAEVAANGALLCDDFGVDDIVSYGNGTYRVFLNPVQADGQTGAAISCGSAVATIGTGTAPSVGTPSNPQSCYNITTTRIVNNIFDVFITQLNPAQSTCHAVNRAFKFIVTGRPQ